MVLRAGTGCRRRVHYTKLDQLSGANWLAEPGARSGFDKSRYTHRNVVERGFCQLKLASRYGKHARNYLGALTLAGLLA
jgi:hypothetical protein